jgi:hybrid cluster-associated redox disulfide protein
MRVSSETNLAEIIKNPEMVKILEKYNLPCLSCPFAKMEIENLKIKDVCKMYNIDEKRLIEELNKKSK